MALVVPDRGETDEVLPGGADGKHLDPLVRRLEEVRRLVNVLPPETGGVDQMRLAIHDGKHDRFLRAAGDHDPVITRLFQLRSEVPAAGRLPPDSREGGLRADRETGAPRETAPHHRADFPVFQLLAATGSFRSLTGTAIVIAFTGHSKAQKPHPMQDFPALSAG